MWEDNFKCNNEIVKFELEKLFMITIFFYSFSSYQSGANMIRTGTFVIITEKSFSSSHFKTNSDFIIQWNLCKTHEIATWLEINTYLIAQFYHISSTIFDKRNQNILICLWVQWIKLSCSYIINWIIKNLFKFLSIICNIDMFILYLVI